MVRRGIDGGELVARTLRSYGVEVAFGVHGGHLNSVLMGFKRNEIRIVDTRHEAVGVNAADGYARATGRLGVAFATASAGFTNAVAGLGVAFADRSPVLVITSSPPLRDAEMNTFQGILDQVAVAAPITRWAHQITVVEEIPRLLGFAIRRALTGGRGPVLVDIPIDVLFTTVDEDTVIQGGGPGLPAPPAPAPAAAAEALRILREAERPAIIVGEGAMHTGGRLVEFAERSGIPVFTQWGLHDVLPFDHPLNGFHVRGLTMGKFQGLGSPDAILLLGARTGMSEDVRKGHVIPAEARLIHVDAEGAEIGRILPAEVGITADAGETLDCFLADDRPWPDRGAWATAIAAASRFPREYAKAPVELDGRLHPYHAAEELMRILPAGTQLIADGSDATHWLDDVIHHGRLAGSTGYGGYLVHLGTGFGFAIGRQIAHPGERLVLFTGDGAFGLHAAEIDTMVRHGLPIVVVLFNNAAWGSSTQGQLLYYGEDGVLASRLADSDYEQVATAFGARGERVGKLADLGPAIRRAFDAGGPALVNVTVADTEDALAAPLLDYTDDPDTLVVPYYDNIRKRK